MQKLEFHSNRNKSKYSCFPRSVYKNMYHVNYTLKTYRLHYDTVQYLQYDNILKEYNI